MSADPGERPVPRSSSPIPAGRSTLDEPELVGGVVQPTPRVVTRLLRVEDYDAVAELQRNSFGGMSSWTREQFVSQVRIFPEGQICVEANGKVVASSSSMIVHSGTMRPEHSFADVTADSMITSHDPTGDLLYGIDIVVDPARRGQRLARRMYDERKALIERLNLRGLLIAGRLPGYHRVADRMTAAEYVEEVRAKRMRDEVILAQLANGFEIVNLIEDYLPSDGESLGWALLMQWTNPMHVASVADESGVGLVRVASVQYAMRTVSTFDDFATHCEFFIDTAAEYRADFVVFPELLTNQLLGLVPEARPALSARNLSRFTDEYVTFFTRMAIDYDVNIVAGSHMTLQDNALYNVAYLFRRDGSMAAQKKVHITAAEERWWGLVGGDRFSVIDTDCGKIAILLCDDIESPELSRMAAADGARILIVPYNTDIRSSYYRVRSCAQTRAIENHVYVVLSGATGNLPMVEGADIHYAQSAIFTPSDIAFPHDAVAAEATPNIETMLIHDLDLDLLRRTRRRDAPRAWMDRRLDMFDWSYPEAADGP